MTQKISADPGVRCPGHHDRGDHTSFQCVLDAGHDGYCQPYRAPDVDEWRVLQTEAARLQSELDALRAIIESGAQPGKDAADLLAKVLRGDYQWPNGVAWAVKEAHRMMTGGKPDGVYVREQKGGAE